MMPHDDEPTTLVVVRTFDASAAELFEAWTESSLLTQWLAPGALRVTHASADARPGGEYRIVAVDPLGTEHVTTGEYLEVVPGSRLVQTWVYHGHPTIERYFTRLTVEFRETSADSTELTIRQELLLTPMDREGNRYGWRLCLDKLEGLLRR
ncbi:MAG: SRPBCC domain-containing protein [Gemmatimonadaceae bacterium]